MLHIFDLIRDEETLRLSIIIANMCLKERKDSQMPEKGKQ